MSFSAFVLRLEEEFNSILTFWNCVIAITDYGLLPTNDENTALVEFVRLDIRSASQFQPLEPLCTLIHYSVMRCHV